MIGLYLIVWGFALFTFWIFTLKTNAVFAGIFGFVTLAAWVLAGAYFKVGSGDYEAAGKLQKVHYPQYGAFQQLRVSSHALRGTNGLYCV